MKACIYLVISPALHGRSPQDYLGGKIEHTTEARLFISD